MLSALPGIEILNWFNGIFSARLDYDDDLCRLECIRFIHDKKHYSYRTEELIDRRGSEVGLYYDLMTRFDCCILF